VVILLSILRSALASWNQTGADMLYRIFVSLSFGVCLIWLLAPYLAQFPRLARFFGYLLLIVFAAIVHGLDVGDTQEFLPYLVMAGIGAVCVALAISLAALRRSVAAEVIPSGVLDAGRSSGWPSHGWSSQRRSWLWPGEPRARPSASLRWWPWA